MMSAYLHLFDSLPARALEPIGCFGDASVASLVDLATCFNTYTVLSDYYTAETYAVAQPNDKQRTDWMQLITDVLDMADDASDDACAEIVVPDSMQDIFTVSLFTSSPDGAQFCIVSELYATPEHYYAKGWGIFLAPTKPSLGIHLASPHPMFDFYTPSQAITVFQSTGARSLLISGRHRAAFNESTNCVPSTASSTYYFTDPTHDANEPFSLANIAISAWQNAHGGCPSKSCAYIQFHGKASKSCSTVDMMVSAGLGSSNAAWYLDDVDRPAKRLRAELASNFPTYNISLPSDTTCSLTATNNVFGRLLNGVPESEICTTSATADDATGQFIHIEQAYEATLEYAYDGWVNALVSSFSVRTSPSPIVDLISR